MKSRLAEWLNRAAHLERTLGAHVEGAAARLSASRRQPIEVMHGVVDAVAAELQAAGRGLMAFPYTHVRVVLAAPTPKDRARLEVAAEGPPSLAERIAERLATAQVSTPPPTIKLVFVLAPRPEWTNPDFALELSRPVAPTDPAPPVLPAQPHRPDLVLTTESGITDAATYRFTGGVIAIGRGVEVRHRDGRLLRTNQVAFVEGAGDVNRSVSRHHAHITAEASDGSYRLFDDVGGERTSVVRDGQGLRVPHGRGLRLRSGDVVALGDARLRVALQPD